MAGKSNGIKLFFVGIVIGICISMVISVVFLNDNKDIFATITSDEHDALKLIKVTKITESNDGLLSLYNSIESPSNMIPVHLDNHTQMAQKLKTQRRKYGGGDVDPAHLGGFFANDTNSYERQMWEWAIDKFNIKSVLDVGCGQGYSTLFFVKHPSIERVKCVEGSSDAIENSLVKNITVQHDYTLGPYWPQESYDMVWCVEV